MGISSYDPGGKVFPTDVFLGDGWAGEAAVGQLRGAMGFPQAQCTIFSTSRFAYFALSHPQSQSNTIHW